MTTLAKKLLVALGLTMFFGGGFVAILYFTGTNPADTAPTGTEGTSEDSSAAVQKTEEMLQNIKTLNSYKLDTSFFNDGTFKSLKDFRQEVKDVPTGRENPFGPVN